MLTLARAVRETIFAAVDRTAGVFDEVARGLESRYRIDRELGRGGMATVFLARDVVHDRPVAIKVLNPDIAAGVSTERFLREIRLLATLQHPNILPLHDSGEVSGIPYFVMPFVSGESLRDKLNHEGSLPVALAVRLAGEAAAALDYAHRQGIIHRDIKPENILLSDDHVIIADFGIARAAAQSKDDRITRTSVTIGTPAYMSPEQAAADENIDGRSDIYSLACVVFEMLSGQAPFTGSTPAAVIANRFSHAAPGISSMATGIPMAVDTALATALSFDPENRPRSAAEFSSMLSASNAVDPQKKSTRPLAIAAALFIGAAGALAWYLSTDIANPSVHPAAVISRPAGQSGHTIDPEAYALYLQGRQTLEKAASGNLDKAIEYFNGAIRHDSLYAAAWAGLADAHTSRGVGNIVSVPPRPEFEQGRFAAMRALALDSTLAEAHTALALVQMMYDYDWELSARSLDRAQAFDPGWEVTYLYRSFLLTWEAKYDSATTVAREAGHMNPDDFRTRQEYGRTLILASRFAEAEKVIQRDISLQPGNFRLKQLLGDALIAEGKYDDAVAALEAAQKISPGTSRTTAFRIAAYGRAGRDDRARAIMDSLLSLSESQFVPALDLAIAYAGMRNRDQTMSWLERGFDDRTLRPFIRDPLFDFIKTDLRFRALLTRMHLSPD